MEQLRFSIPEILSLIGLAQCVYVLVYMVLRSGDTKRAVLPFVYFFVLGSAFFLDFSKRFIGSFTDYYDLAPWFFWFMGPPLSVLLIIQIARIQYVPGLKHFWVLLLTPLALVAAFFLARQDQSCVWPASCAVLHEWLVIAGLIAGAVSMMAIWGRRGMLENLGREKSGKDRYWLILMLIFINLGFLTVMLVSLTEALDIADAEVIRTVLGIGLVYLAGTSLFRIYPQAVYLVRPEEKREFSADERALARKIEMLLEREKIYHEPAYSRTDLARELQTPETVISKVINRHFGKSFPQLLNEKRVADARWMLRETDASIKVIAQEVGFNSTASFNRVFRDLTGESPSAYRGGGKA